MGDVIADMASLITLLHLHDGKTTVLDENNKPWLIRSGQFSDGSPGVLAFSADRTPEDPRSPFKISSVDLMVEPRQYDPEHYPVFPLYVLANR